MVLVKILGVGFPNPGGRGVSKQGFVEFSPRFNKFISIFVHKMFIKYSFNNNVEHSLVSSNSSYFIVIRVIMGLKGGTNVFWKLLRIAVPSKLTISDMKQNKIHINNNNNKIDMPLTIDTDNHDSLQILLLKAHAINTINQENLTFIHSRKGQQVVTHHQCDL